MIAQRTLSILLTGLLLAFVTTSLTGCCCGDMSALQEIAEEEAKRQAEEAANNEGDDDEGDDDDEAKGDDDDDDDDTPSKAEGDDDDDDGGSADGIAGLSEKNLKSTIKSKLKGWKVTNTTNSEGGGTKTHVLSIQKGLKFATITLQKHKTETTAKFSAKALKKIDNTAVARDGKTVLYIFSTGKGKTSAKSILEKLSK